MTGHSQSDIETAGGLAVLALILATLAFVAACLALVIAL